jgi:hypothetical protein
MIGKVRPTVGTGDLELVLRRLERIASHPREELEDEETVDLLSVLQYRLHSAGELAAGQVAADEEWTQHELAAALADARDATADVAEAASQGGADAAAALVPEWRGALFRVRLAQMRMAKQPRRLPAVRSQPKRHEERSALFATLLVLAGTFVVTCGAVVGIWPLWAGGLLLVAGGFFVYRP